MKNTYDDRALTGIVVDAGHGRYSYTKTSK